MISHHVKFVVDCLMNTALEIEMWTNLVETVALYLKNLVKAFEQHFLHKDCSHHSLEPVA